MGAPNKLHTLQPYRFRPSKNAWKRVSHQHSDKDIFLPRSFRLLTWNVDFTGERVAARLAAVLEHIQGELGKGEEAPEPCVVLLQEVHHLAMDVILEDPWVRAHFAVAPISPRRHWPEGAFYGNVTLVARSIPIVQVVSLEFGCSTMHRNAVMVDVRLGTGETGETGDSADEGDARAATLRVANTHLESLVQGAGARPEQLGLIAGFLKGEFLAGELAGGIVGGDMNAIGVSDTPTVGAVGLRDAWRKGDKNERGFTWGFQPASGEYPAGRLDKILYVPRVGFDVHEPRRVGVGLMADGAWASDHYGLVTTVRITH